VALDDDDRKWFDERIGHHVGEATANHTAPPQVAGKVKLAGGIMALVMLAGGVLGGWFVVTKPEAQAAAEKAAQSRQHIRGTVKDLEHKHELDQQRNDAAHQMQLQIQTEMRDNLKRVFRKQWETGVK
jgi:hypothetical protein